MGGMNQLVRVAKQPQNAEKGRFAATSTRIVMNVY
jgi:hypothetical protein